MNAGCYESNSGNNEGHHFVITSIADEPVQQRRSEAQDSQIDQGDAAQSGKGFPATVFVTYTSPPVEKTLEAIQRVFCYAFQDAPEGTTIPRLNVNVLDGKPFELEVPIDPREAGARPVIAVDTGDVEPVEWPEDYEAPAIGRPVV